MIQEEQGVVGHFKHEKLLLQLLEDTIHQLRGKEAKIAQLQNVISHHQNALNNRDESQENQTQYSYDQEQNKQAQFIQRVAGVLGERQQDQMGMLMASRQIEHENARLKLNLHQKWEEVTQLRQKVKAIQGQLRSKNSDLEYLCIQNNNLRLKLSQLQSQQLSNALKFEELESIKRSLENADSQKLELEQKLKTERQRGNELQKEVERLKDELSLHCSQFYEANSVFNKYEWKLFRLENELDMFAKDKIEQKLVIQKLELSLVAMQQTILNQEAIILSDKEEISQLQGKNFFLRADAEQKRQEIDKLQREYDLLKVKLEEAMRVKLEEEEKNKDLEQAQRLRLEEVRKLTLELEGQKNDFEFRIKKKEGEQNQIIYYLNQKIDDLENSKRKGRQIEQKLAQLKETVQSKQAENYQLSQKVIQLQQKIENQTAKIEQLQISLDSASKIVENGVYMSAMRASEWKKSKIDLESVIQAQNQRINQLRVWICEKDQTNQSKAMKLNEVQLQLQEAKEKWLEMYGRLSRTQHMLEQSKLSKQKLQLQFASKKTMEQQVRLLENEKVMNSIKKEFKTVYEQKQQLTYACEILRKQLSIKDEYLAVMKSREIEHIQLQITSQYQKKKLKEELETAKKQYAQALALNSSHQQLLEKLREEAKQMNELTSLRLDEISEVLAYPIQTPEQPEITVKFEIMQQEDEHFEEMECKKEKHANELKRKIEQYTTEVRGLMKTMIEI